MATHDFDKQVFDASVRIESHEIKLSSLQIECEQLQKQIGELKEKMAYHKRQIKAFGEFKKQFEAMRDAIN